MGASGVGEVAPADEQDASLARRLVTAPEAEREQAVLEIVRTQVAKVLGHASSEAVDTRRAFKELGFDSLAAVELRNILARTTGLRLPLTLIFEQPNVAALIQHLLRELQTTTSSDVALPQLTADPEHRFDPFPLSAIQSAYLVGRGGAFDLGEVSTHLYFEVNVKQLDRERLNLALRRLIDRHDMLRAVISEDGMQRVLEVVPPYDIHEADLTRASSQDVERHLRSVRDELSHEVRPADRWPLFELRVTRLSGGDAVVHCSLDALIMDAASMSLVIGELESLYAPRARLGALGGDAA